MHSDCFRSFDPSPSLGYLYGYHEEGNRDVWCVANFNASRGSGELEGLGKEDVLPRKVNASPPRCAARAVPVPGLVEAPRAHVPPPFAGNPGSILVTWSLNKLQPT